MPAIPMMIAIFCTAFSDPVAFKGWSNYTCALNVGADTRTLGKQLVDYYHFNTTLMYAGPTFCSYINPSQVNSVVTDNADPSSGELMMAGGKLGFDCNDDGNPLCDSHEQLAAIIADPGKMCMP